MKRIYIFLAFFLCFHQLSAQIGRCGCEARLVYNANCCYSFQVKFDPTLSCNNGDFREIILNTALHPGFTSDIISASGITGITATVNGTGDEATFNSIFDIGLAAGNNWFEVGQVCLESTFPSSIFNMSANDSQVPPVSGCTAQFQENVICQGPIILIDTTKLYGDTLANKPQKIKAFENAYYVVGTKEISGTEFATMTKFDLATGALLWQEELNIPSLITDFEFDPVSKDLILVGRARDVNNPGGYNDAALMVRLLSATGMPNGSKLYHAEELDAFHRITRQKNPLNANHHFYVTGSKTRVFQSGATRKVSVLLNMNASMGINWMTYYEPISSLLVYHVYKGLYPLADGNIVMTGNNANPINGAVFVVSGVDGSPITAAEFGVGFALTDVVEFPVSKYLAVCGRDVNTNEAILLKLDGSLALEDARRYPDLEGFFDLGKEGTNSLYASSKVKNTMDPTYGILKVNFNGPGMIMTNNLFRHINNSSIYTDICNGRISVTDNHTAVFYTDGRENTIGPNNFDLMIGVYDLDINDPCALRMGANTLLDQPVEQFLGFFQEDIVEPTFIHIPGVTPINYTCTRFCGPPCMAEAEYTWTSLCLDATFTNHSTGTPPLTYEWYIGSCTGTPVSTAQNPIITFPAYGTYTVCLKVTDGDGCTDTFSDQVTLEDNVDPVLNCSDVIFPTDPGVCNAEITIPYSVSDNCDPNPTVTCSIGGLPVGPVVTLPKGTHTVTCVATDQAGNTSTCTFTITIEDQEAPVVTNCPGDINLVVPACEDGSVATWTPPAFTDNCPMMTVTQTHNPGDFFPCGSTMVTYTATDMSGIVTTCSFNVNVQCQCGTITDAMISCTPTKYEYDYTIVVDNLTGAINPSSNCTVNVISNQTNTLVTVGAVNWSASQATITGTVSNSVAPIPFNLNLIAQLTCQCPSGQSVQCDLPVTLTTPCCDTLTIDDQMVCQSDDEFFVPILGCGNLDFVSQVNWYVAPAPCPPSSWGPPFKSIPGSACVDLCLIPAFFSGDICVYAEVIQDSNAGPCTIYTTNVATITFCEPVTCSIPGQEYCYTGTPVTPAPLVASLTPSSPDCDYTIQWYDQNGPISGATGLSYQPPPLDFLGGPLDCSYEHVFTAEITDDCGVRQCQAVIRLDNEAVPIGDLFLDPPKMLPLCYGDDAILKFEPGCVDDPPDWKWFSHTTGLPYSPVSGANQTTILNTNKLYEDTWYAVRAGNGVCPQQEIEFKIDVKDEFKINYFTAAYDFPCSPSAVFMELDIAPCFLILAQEKNGASCDCDYTVEWYKDGHLIGTTNHTTTPVNFTYNNPDLIDGGNYYAVVKDNCCGAEIKSDVVPLLPPSTAFATGPCFICESVPLQPVELIGGVDGLAPGVTCTVQWTTPDGNIVSNPFQTNIFVDQPGTYFFTATCSDGCVKTAFFELDSCLPPLGPALLVSPVVYLQGPYDLVSGFMYDNLRTNNLLPLTEPFTELGYTHVGGGGGEMTQQAVFDVSDLNAIVDWVLVELRDKDDPSMVLATRSALLQVNGAVVDVDGLSPVEFVDLPSDDYFIVVKHRNHLGVMSAMPKALSNVTTVVDFTSDLNYVAGGINGIASLGDGKLGLFSGDFNRNGQVQNTDYADMVMTIGLAGYQAGDFDLNGQVQNSDLQLKLVPNIGRGEGF